MTKILIGPAGTGGAELESFQALKKQDLDAVEIEFTYSVWMKKEQAIAIRELNKKLGLRLSIHGSYFINLNSEDKAKVVKYMQNLTKLSILYNSLKQAS